MIDAEHTWAKLDAQRDATLDTWAQALSDARLADDLLKLSENVRWCDPQQRAATLREAARRLKGATR